MKKIAVFLTLILAFTTNAISQEKWTPEKIMEYKNITGTNISPDGKYVAYVVRTPVMADDKSEYNSQIWVAAVDGSFDIQYTRGEKSSSSPKFSPDSKKIAFTSNRNDNKNQIFVMRLMGGEPEQITKADKSVGSFEWSPDGENIAYLMSDPETEEEKKQKKGKTDVIIVDTNYKFNHIYTVPVEETEGERKSQRLTNGEFHVRDFDWSPDGSTIAFSHSPTPRINDLGLRANISTVPSDSGAVNQLVNRPGTDYNPRYSPDGKSLVFQSSGGKPERVGLNDFYKYDIESGEYEALKQTPNRQSSFVSWVNDEQILLSEPYKTSSSIFALPTQKDLKIEPNAYPEVTETGLPLLTSSNGTIGGVSVSKSGNAISYVYEEPGMPEEIYVSDLKGGNVKKLTSQNAGFNPPKTAKTELVSWKSKDGMVIEGLLTYPVDFEDGKKYPIILQIHGGPGGVFTKGYTGAPSIYMTQYFAENGYIILRPNPRGSTGYGKEFRYANIMDWGYGDYQDLMTGVDHVIDMGIADKKNQFVM
ncbi:MAG: prolyl oligopeptidase family serine peptidase, partial [Draconibacterium sp.]|nr:prolyl oligopeptidase family serine peptidase [Draconibacterium sp.]